MWPVPVDVGQRAKANGACGTCLTHTCRHVYVSMWQIIYVLSIFATGDYEGKALRVLMSFNTKCQRALAIILRRSAAFASHRNPEPCEHKCSNAVGHEFPCGSAINNVAVGRFGLGSSGAKAMAAVVCSPGMSSDRRLMSVHMPILMSVHMPILIPFFFKLGQ